MPVCLQHSTLNLRENGFTLSWLLEFNIPIKSCCLHEAATYAVIYIPLGQDLPVVHKLYVHSKSK
jgi:hypothetical protein